MTILSGDIVRPAPAPTPVAGRGDPGGRTGRRTSWVALAAGLTVSAGLLHALVVSWHLQHPAAALLFALTAAVQVGLGAVLAFRPRLRRTALVMGALNLVFVGAWVASRTVGLPVIAPEREPVGLPDLTAAAMALVAGVLLLRVGHRRSAGPLRLSPLWVLAAVPALLGLAFPHDHAGGEAAAANHDAAHHDAANHEAGHHGAGHDAGAVPLTLADDPIFSGADTSHASEAQLRAAKSLVEDTRSAVAARFPDEASLIAAGYHSIGDGRRVGGRFEHFVNTAYLSDGLELEPERVESIVLENTNAGKRVVSAMYILELGKTMTDVPDIAGELTLWHDHQNLCWDDFGLRLAGVLIDGQCFPGGTFRPTPPMLHVWIQDHPCGPFTGIDGHGSGCTAHRH